RDIQDRSAPRGRAPFSPRPYSPLQLPSICVLVTNLSDGWNSLCHLLAKEHGQFQLQVKSTRPHVEWPLHSLQVWNGGQSVRLVRAMRDTDGWDFFQKGEPQDFEE
ncbi:MAG TPA: hypothetical protein VN524_08690, partial [Hyphomicrobiaceae bacterium]|nr:hypothetical protein [Hyphomicrobiaceae bacterium]